MELERFIAELYQIGRSVKFDGDMPMIKNYLKIEIERGMLLMRTFVLSGNGDSERVCVEYYHTWFDHLKDKHFPKWLLKYFPVKKTKEWYYKKQSVRLCPHSSEKWEKNKIEHLVFLK